MDLNARQLTSWIDTVDQWCLQRILDIRWHNFVRNADICRITNTSHHFYPSLSPVVSLSLGILHECMRTHMLAKPSSDLFQRIGGGHWGGCAQPGWRMFMMTCLCWILGYMRLEIWHKISLSGDWCLWTVLLTRSSACYYWNAKAGTHFTIPQVGRLSWLRQSRKGCSPNTQILLSSWQWDSIPSTHNLVIWYPFEGDWMGFSWR